MFYANLVPLAARRGEALPRRPAVGTLRRVWEVEREFAAAAGAKQES
jgi:hypothetical protein